MIEDVVEQVEDVKALSFRRWLHQFPFTVKAWLAPALNCSVGLCERGEIFSYGRDSGV